jgi:hypothetical protein
MSDCYAHDALALFLHGPLPAAAEDGVSRRLSHPRTAEVTTDPRTM